jgi:hypothetical protein
MRFHALPCLILAAAGLSTSAPATSAEPVTTFNTTAPTDDLKGNLPTIMNKFHVNVPEASQPRSFAVVCGSKVLDQKPIVAVTEKLTFTVTGRSKRPGSLLPRGIAHLKAGLVSTGINPS